jgi:hypothetical protein
MRHVPLKHQFTFNGLHDVLFQKTELFITGTTDCFGGLRTGVRLVIVQLKDEMHAELVPKFHVALQASHAALQMVTLKISPYTNITLTFDFDFSLDYPVRGGYGLWSPAPLRKKAIVGGSAPRRTGRQTISRNIT